MKYYRELDVKHFETIVEKSLAFVRGSDEISRPNAVYDGHTSKWITLDHVALLIACPEIVEAFAEYDLRCTYAGAFIITASPLTPPPHIDSPALISSARINLPLLNCKRTFTEFFSNVVSKKTTELGFLIAINTDYVLEDRVEITKATVIRIKEPHRVLIPADNPIPRLTLSLDFHRDPAFLLD